MAMAKGNHGIAISIFTVLGSLAVIFTINRPAVLAPATSPDALTSFRSKIDSLKQAHDNGVRAEVRVSEMELNSASEDFNKHCEDNVYWAPPGTEVYLRGNRGGLYVPLKPRGILLHVRVVVRERTGYPEPAAIWFGIIPVPARAVTSTLGWFSDQNGMPIWHQPYTLPDYITNARIENSELVLETR